MGGKMFPPFQIFSLTNRQCVLSYSQWDCDAVHRVKNPSDSDEATGVKTGFLLLVHIFQ